MHNTYGQDRSQEQDSFATGLFCWVRHPFYDAALLCVVTTSLLTANWFILLTGGTVFTLLVLRADREEHQLLARFGESYRAYIQQTGRFLPRLS